MADQRVLDGLPDWKETSPYAKNAWATFAKYANATSSLLTEDERFGTFKNARFQGDYFGNLTYSIFITFAIAQGLSLLPLPAIVHWLFNGKEADKQAKAELWRHRADRGWNALIAISYMIAGIAGLCELFLPISDAFVANNLGLLIWLTIALISFVLGLTHATIGSRQNREAEQGAETANHTAFLSIGVLLLLLPQESQSNGVMQVWAGSLYIFSSMGLLAHAKDVTESRAGAIAVRFFQQGAFFAGSILMICRNYDQVLNVQYFTQNATSQPNFVFLAIIWFFVAVSFLSLLVRGCYNCISQASDRITSGAKRAKSAGHSYSYRRDDM